jgi:hypothetical protein
MKSSHSKFVEGDNTDLVITLGKNVHGHHKIPRIHFSYSATPAAGCYLKIEILESEETSTYRIWDKMFVSQAGPGPLELGKTAELGLMTGKNQGVKITLTAGGTGILSTLSLPGYEQSALN